MTVQNNTISVGGFTPLSILKPLEQGSWDAAARREFKSLQEETDPEIFWNDLLHMGLDFKQRGRNFEALSLLGYLQSQSSKMPEATALKVRGEYEAMVGRGSLGPRIEFLGNQFLREVIHPKNIVPLMAGQMAYQVARTGTLARLAQGTGVLRGLKARSLAGGVGFLAEVPVFVGTHRGMQHFTGETLLPWSKDLAQAARTLGILKFAGFLGQGAFHRVNRISELVPGAALSPIPRLGRVLIPQTAMVGGLMVAGAVEAKIQGTPLASMDHLLLNALSTVATYGIAGRLGPSLLGPRWARFQLEMGMRNRIFYEALEGPRPPKFKLKDLLSQMPSLQGGTQALVLATAGPSRGRWVPENSFAMEGPVEEGILATGFPSPASLGKKVLEQAKAPFRERNKERIEELKKEESPNRRQALEREGTVLQALLEAKNLSQWFDNFGPLRIFYLVQGRTVGREQVKRLFGVEKEIFAKVQQEELYHLLIQSSEEGVPFLKFPHNAPLPPVLRLENQGPAPSILLTSPLLTSRLSPRYFRLDDLNLHQSVVSKKGVADYRQLMREGGKIGLIKVASEPGETPFIYDGYHRFYAAKKEGYSHILGFQEKYFNRPESKPLSFADIKPISHEEFLKLVAGANPLEDPYKQYIMGGWDDGVMD